LNESCKNTKDWKQFIADNHDCPEAIYQQAQTEWEKQVALEFLSNQEDRKLMRQDLESTKKIVWATFVVVAIAAVGQLISTYILPFI